MANFSVEWLSKSYYEDDILHSKVHSEMEEFTKGPRSTYFPTSPNDSCGYTSGSESEVGYESEWEVTQQRRMRTKFSSEQVRILENAFGRHNYLGTMQRRKIAEKLLLSETQVKTWFQNRRMKLKRENLYLRPELPFPVVLLAPLRFQHALSGQLLRESGFYPQLEPLHRAAVPAAAPPQHCSHPVTMGRFFY